MEINNALWLSPMEGVSDLGFRSICAKRGADLTFTEMIRADALVRNNKATLELIDTHDRNIPTGIQLIASKPKILQQALEIITKKIQDKSTPFLNLSCIDLNFGCPSLDIISKGGGPALMKREQRMKDLLHTLKKYSPLPCGIKIRLGLGNADKKNKVYLRCVKIANEIGLDWIIVHPKTASERSLDPIDIYALKEIIAESKIPIIGNGFVMDGKSAKTLLDLGCSGVMIARGAIINPWIFEEIRSFLNTGKTVKIEKDYNALLSEYEAIVHKYGTKDKFLEYHHAQFKAHIAGNFKYHSPRRIKKWN
jgi:tRNA-dihydrouridine synthase B